MRRLPNLARFALLTVGLLLAAACSAQGDGHAAATSGSAAASTATAASTAAAATHYTAGQQYVILRQQPGQPAPTGPVVLVEVFSYACPHCAEFAPFMDKLRAQLPKGVQVRYMPAVFNAQWMPSAQAFYAARQLGVLDKTHDALFKAHLAHYPLNTLQDMAAWYGHQGVDPKKFLTAATNATTAEDMAMDMHTEMGWGVDGTPTLVVGRLASDAKDAPLVGLLRNGDNFGDYASLQRIGLWMVNKVRDQH